MQFSNLEKHSILQKSFCPSSEDKIVRFSDKDKQSKFLEPRSLFYRNYPNGISTSLPEEGAAGFLRQRFRQNSKNYQSFALCGRILTYVFPQQLNLSLESKLVGSKNI